MTEKKRHFKINYTKPITKGNSGEPDVVQSGGQIRVTMKGQEPIRPKVVNGRIPSHHEGIRIIDHGSTPEPTEGFLGRRFKR